MKITGSENILVSGAMIFKSPIIYIIYIMKLHQGD